MDRPILVVFTGLIALVGLVQYAAMNRQPPAASPVETAPEPSPLDKQVAQALEERREAKRQEEIREREAKLKAKLAAEEAAKNPWFYVDWDDDMGRRSRSATVMSSEPFELDFPYGGLQFARLTLRKTQRGKDVVFRIKRGQLMCTLGCSVRVKFDNGKLQRWGAVGTADSSTETIFLRRASRFWAKVKKAKVVRIEATLYQAGSRVFTFPVKNFDEKEWEKNYGRP